MSDLTPKPITTTAHPLQLSQPQLPMRTEELTFQACPQLFAALAVAREKCKAAAKDGENKHHGYRYTSADNVIATADEAMEGSGLAVVPYRTKMVALGSGSSCIYALDRIMILTHSSGECMPLYVEGFPVIPDRGRPLDKAYPIALTTSYAYLLRDLLMMRRGVQEDVAAQNDQRTPVATSPIPRATPEQLTKLRQARDILNINAERWKEILAKRQDADGKPVTTARDLSPEQCDELYKAMAHKIQVRQLEEGMKTQDPVNRDAARSPEASFPAPVNANGK